ncbi:HTH_38 domain-containing protein [Trichonephila clavipes]|nr:HTH_38 domain-containing protein [Trichonephila clavipes]
MSRRKQRSAFDQVSEFYRGRIVAYRDCGLFFREIGSHVGRNYTTVMRISDRWMQEGPMWSIASISVHHFTVCAYHSTLFIAEWSVRITSIAWSTLDAESQTSPPPMADPEWKLVDVITKPVRPERRREDATNKWRNQSGRIKPIQRRPCPYYLRSRIQENDGIPKELSNIEINGIPRSTLQRRSLSREALDGDPVHRI